MYELPMFPLEHTVLPTSIVPLHIFEPRYRQFARDITPLAEPEFGIAPIERGREVGGEEVRSNIGVVARVIEHEEFPDGRWSVVALATRRIDVHEWREDNPYPRAIVRDRPDINDFCDPSGVPHAGEGSQKLEGAFRRVAGAVVRLMPGRPLPEWTSPDWAMPEDAAHAIWTVCVASEVGALDAAKLLTIVSVVQRGEVAAQLIEERADVLEALADERG